MGFRYRKSVRLSKGVRMNISKKGVGVSVGGKGMTTSVGPSGRRTTISAPGTGLSYEVRHGKKNSKNNESGCGAYIVMAIILIVLLIIFV